MTEPSPPIDAGASAPENQGPAPAESGARAARDERHGRLALGLAGFLPAAALIAFIALQNTNFILRDDYDGALSDANGYTDRALAIAHNLRDGPDGSDFQTGPHIYSPLNWILGGLFAFLTGPTPKALRLFNSLYLPAALIYLYLFARLFLGRWGALLAVFLGGSNSLTLYYSRYFLQDTPLYLAVTASLYHLARSRWLRNPPHTVATLAFVGFGAAMKPQFAVMAASPIILTGAMGWAIGAHRGRKIPLTLLWQVGLLLAFAWAAHRLRPDLFDLLPRAGTAVRQSTYSYSIVVPQNAEGGGLIRGALYWTMGLVVLARYLAAPLVALALAGTAWGWFRLRGRGLGTAFLGIPLVFLATDALIVWSGAHEEFKRYFAPVLLLYGIPVAALADLARSGRIRLALLSGITALALTGWAGPRFIPSVFDCQPRCLFPQWRIEGRATKDYPLFVYKAWDEPVDRPARMRRDEQTLLETLREAPVLRHEIGRRMQVACVCSDWPTNDSFHWLQGLSDERLEFTRAKSLRDALAADFLLVVWPSTSALPDDEYRAMAASLRYEPLRARLGLDEIASIGLRGGEILRLYRQRPSASLKDSVERAVGWFETLMVPGSWKKGAETLAGEVRGPESDETAGIFRRLTGIDEGDARAVPPDSNSFGPATRRLLEWRRQLARPAAEAGRAEGIVAALLNGPEAGPGMMLMSARAVFEDGAKDLAATLIREGIKRYPNHQETWSTARRLVPQGLPFHEGLAVMGERLAINHPLTFKIEHYQNVVDSFRLARLANEIEPIPGLYNSRSERLSLLERDHPESLPTLLTQIASLDSQNTTTLELEDLLRRAIALNGTEMIDAELYNSLGLVYVRRGEDGRAIRALRKGGWAGIDSLLVYLSATQTEKKWQGELRRSSNVRFPLQLRGSDPVRMKIAIGLAGSDPDLAYRAFAEMNRTGMVGELPYFSQLASAADPRGLNALEAALRKSRVDFYDGARADAYLALLRLERQRRGEGKSGIPIPDEIEPARQVFIRDLEGIRRAASSLDPVTTTSVEARRVRQEGLRWKPEQALTLPSFESASIWLGEIDFDSPTTRTAYLKLRVVAPGGRGLQRRVGLEGLMPDGDWSSILSCRLLDGVNSTLELEALVTPLAPVRGIRAVGRFAVGAPPSSAPPDRITDSGAPPSDSIPVTLHELTLALAPPGMAPSAAILPTELDGGT